jgi:hypothetical protein
MATAQIDPVSWTKIPRLLALSSARNGIDLNAPENESGDFDRRYYARNYFKSAQWYDFLRQIIAIRYLHSWIPGLLMAHLSSPTQPIIVFEPS